MYLRFITLSAIAALNNIKVIGYYYIDIGLNLNHYEEFKKIFSSGVIYIKVHGFTLKKYP